MAADGGPSQGLGPNQLSFEHNYAYTPAGKVAGKVTAKTLTLSSAAYSGSLTAGYTYDNQGALMQTVYPGCQPSQSCTLTYTLDGMERPTQLEDNLNKIYATGVTYNAANQSSYGRRTYNNLLQLTEADVFEYKYSATRNNGQIVASGDMGTGEVATYQYDALKRLSSATSNKNRGESYGYDGWGNLTQMTPTGSPAGYNGLPSLQVTVDPHTNQMINAPGVSYTPNGNMGFGPNTLSYDALNQLEVVGGGVLYAYDSDNRRMYMYENSGTETVYFYGVDGRKLATFGIGYANQSIQFTQESQNVYFAGFLVRAENAPARTDRLGSEVGSGRRYYPYGVEYNATADDAEKYATYTRDGLTGLDYAMNRYCSSQWGRFLSPDPYLANTYFGSLWAEQLAPTLDAVTQYGNGQWVGGDLRVHVCQHHPARQWPKFLSPAVRRIPRVDADPRAWACFQYRDEPGWFGDPVRR